MLSFLGIGNYNKPTEQRRADGSIQKTLDDGAIEIDFEDGHHQVTDRDGNVEIDDVDSDKESFCEEVDEIGADGKVHHIKKWHHHTVDHFQKHGGKWSFLTIVGIALGVGLGIGLAVAVTSSNGDSAAQSAALAASAGTTMEPVSVIPAKGGEQSRRRLVSRRNANFFSTNLISDALSRVGLNKKLSATTSVPAASLSLVSDYSLHPEPDYSVEDPANGPAQMVTEIGCYIGQIRGRDIGVSMEVGDPNPDFKPYIALVDSSKCEDSDGGANIMKWAVEVETTAPEGGDGVYTSKFKFYMNGNLLWGALVNTVAGGAVVDSKLTFNNGPDVMKGGIMINREDTSKATIKFFQQLDQSVFGGSGFQYDKLAVQENLNTGIGQAISSDGNDVYNIAFSEDAYLRELVGGSVTCVDLASSESLSSADGYVLFNANDGSRSLFSSGSMITNSDGSKEAYVDSWGAWTMDGDKSWLVNDAAIVKVGYSSNGNNAFKLKVANGKLINVKTLKVKLSNLLQAPLSVFDGGSVSRKIAWDGTQLVTVESVVEMCIKYDNDGGYEVFNAAATNTQLCYCYDSNGALQTSGSLDYSSGLSTMQKTSVLSQPTAFVPTSTDYPNGIDVMAGDLWGKIELSYETIQKFYMASAGTFTAGQTVTQASTGATGTIASSTPTMLKGFTCSSCITVTLPWMTDCATPQQQNWGTLPAGAILTQGGTSAVVLAETHCIECGIPIEITAGSFVANADVTVSYPSGGSLKMSWGEALTAISGTLSHNSGSGSVSATSDVMRVKLDTGSVKFESNGVSGTTTEKIFVNSVDKGYAYFNEEISGDIKTIDGDVEVAFQVWSTVQPGTTVPSQLFCYYNCPDATNKATCEAYGSTDCFYPEPSHLNDRGNVDEFLCESSSTGLAANVLPTVGTFANIQGSPAATITWREEDAGGGNYRYVPDVQITNVGKTCTTETMPTLTLTDIPNNCNVGTPALVINVDCMTGTDSDDFAQARTYTFTSADGVLKDSNSNDVSIPSTNPNYYDVNNNGDYMPSVMYGPFLGDNAANKASLKCDWNENIICPYEAYGADSFYMYESGENSRRFTLEDSDGAAVFFSNALSLLYVHSGTDSNSGRSYDGGTSVLTYGGPGQLSGLPVFCIDSNTGVAATECIPEGTTTSTTNGYDIRIDPETVLEDSNGNKYYAKYDSVSEIYPVVSGGASNAKCSSLTLPDGNGDLQLPTLDDAYSNPPHLGSAYPTAAELAANYLYGGDPAVIQGQTLKELQEAAIALAAAIA